ncbi:MAG: hypothetical protein WAN72_18925 [Candidatus Acidiferrales bacterium]
MRNRSNIINAAKPIVGFAVLAGMFVFTAPQVRADDCQHDTAKIDHNLHEAIKHNGPDSKEADHWRHELAEQRERCWDKDHKWWDEDGHRWRTDHDWDEHDHDH